MWCVVRRILVSQFRVLRTGTLFEICNDNLQVTVNAKPEKLNQFNNIEFLQPPEQLMSGFLDFAKEVKQKCDERGAKFSEDELAELFNGSFPGKVRANFFLWVGDLNTIIEGINIILSDLNDIRNDRNSLKGNPVVRSELLLQAFFGEFFKIRENSKIFIKILTQFGVLNNKNKNTFVGFYYKAFDWVYEIRNLMIHQGASIKNDNLEIDFNFLEDIEDSEKTKFLGLLKESNTRENTVEIQCAIYMKLINGIMKNYIAFQSYFNKVLADLIISYEKLALDIKIVEND